MGDFQPGDLVEAIPFETLEPVGDGRYVGGVWAAARIIRDAGVGGFWIIRFEDAVYREHSLSRCNYQDGTDYARTYNAFSLRRTARKFGDVT